MKAYLKEGKNVLFTGTPCQVDGLYRYLRRNYDNLLTLDLVCHGVPSNTLFHSYLLKLEDLKKLRYLYLNSPSKRLGLCISYIR